MLKGIKKIEKKEGHIEFTHENGMLYKMPEDKIPSYSKGIIEAMSGIRNAIRTSIDALKRTVTKVYSRINGVMDLEYAGVGRVQIEEFSLIDDADLICE